MLGRIFPSYRDCVTRAKFEFVLAAQSAGACDAGPKGLRRTTVEFERVHCAAEGLGQDASAKPRYRIVDRLGRRAGWNKPNAFRAQGKGDLARRFGGTPFEWTSLSETIANLGSKQIGL